MARVIASILTVLDPVKGFLKQKQQSAGDRELSDEEQVAGGGFFRRLN